MAIPRVVELARMLVGRVLSEGDAAIDATVGNGHDTIWLADQVGPGGRVLGLDVQQAALASARGRLEEAGISDRVSLVRAGHERLDALVRKPGPFARPAAVMFNLGYLPGGDRSRTTVSATTLPALEAALGIIRPGGIVTVVLYPGHPAGQDESEAVARWASHSARSRAEILRAELLHPASPSPWLLALSPRPGPLLDRPDRFDNIRRRPSASE
ncbi:class I SAM-dependent methyltransferase [Tautonia sociabilis]|uniref:Methyltransferase domain-containing protein n=1 Tax=Tautonia sociabilis TaxID=2080755 RepID=A0A432MQP6_9BACT|nr:class I SAM-dependent methyltransferase [Tautonia sociabilis]RUL89579.1 methyltransferase domain-containing protein [Tautonia sociabilis]